MSCTGFSHGMEVRADKELIHFGRVIKEGTIGKVEKIDRDKHQIDVRFEKVGLVRGLPAHSFGPATAGAATS